MQEILPLVLNGADLTPIQTVPNWDRVPWLEEKRLALVVDQLKSPRGMVTHLPYHLMPPSFHASKAKVKEGGAGSPAPPRRRPFPHTLRRMAPVTLLHRCSIGPRLGDLRHEGPEGRGGVFVPLPQDGPVPRDAGNPR